MVGQPAPGGLAEDTFGLVVRGDIPLIVGWLPADAEIQESQRDLQCFADVLRQFSVGQLPVRDSQPLPGEFNVIGEQRLQDRIVPAPGQLTEELEGAGLRS